MGFLVLLPHGAAQMLVGLASQRGVEGSAPVLMAVRACFLRMGLRREFVSGPRLTSGEWKLSFAFLQFTLSKSDRQGVNDAVVTL